MPTCRPLSQRNELQFSLGSPERADVVKTVNARWAHGLWAPWASPPQARGPPAPGSVCSACTLLSLSLGRPGACLVVICHLATKGEFFRDVAL